MISPAHCRLLARYNAWQNSSLASAADALDDDARRMMRGAFFGSISATFAHVFRDDVLWLRRFSGWTGRSRPDVQEEPPDDWGAFRHARVRLDAAFVAWADAVTDAALEGELDWSPGDGIAPSLKPRWVCVTHLFNHQTHHRGQIHAMLTAAGARLEPTDMIRLG